jgi:tetratricopeptide (TPR) repeat protein
MNARHQPTPCPVAILLALAVTATSAAAGPPGLQAPGQPPPGAATPARPARPPAAARGGAEFERVAKAAEDARVAERLDEAVRLYEQALTLRPAWTEGRWYLATILYSLERFQPARDAFRQVTAEKPDDGRSWAFKGLCEFELRSYDRALADLQRAQRLGIPGKEVYHVATYHLGVLLTRHEQFEESLEYLSTLAREGNESTSMAEALGLSVLRMPVLPSELQPHKREQVLMAGRATVHWANARRAAARAGFEELLLRYPEAPNAHYAFGVFLLKEDADAALEQFRAELRLQPYHVESMLQIALEKNLRAEHEEALKLAEKAVELAPQNPAGRNILGRTLLNRDDVEGAVKQLEMGVKIAPLSREMRFELARAYTRAGRKEDAARELEAFQKLEAAAKAQRSPESTPAAADPASTQKPPG